MADQVEVSTVLIYAEVQDKRLFICQAGAYAEIETEALHVCQAGAYVEIEEPWAIDIYGPRIQAI